MVYPMPYSSLLGVLEARKGRMIWGRWKAGTRALLACLPVARGRHGPDTVSPTTLTPMLPFFGSTARALSKRPCLSYTVKAAIRGNHQLSAPAEVGSDEYGSSILRLVRKRMHERDLILGQVSISAVLSSAVDTYLLAFGIKL